MEDQALTRGLLITLEGGEGCGKSTQIRLLYKKLKSQGKKVYWTREPGGTKVGDQIRNILLDRKNHRLSAVSETLLYMASRSQLVSEVIAPKLKLGYIVLCDRWVDATVAYQGFAGGVDRNWIQSLGRVATQGMAPHLSLYLDLPVRVGLERVRRRRKADRLEVKNLSFHQKVRAGYMWIAKNEPRRFKRLELHKNDSIESVQELIWDEAKHVLARR